MARVREELLPWDSQPQEVVEFWLGNPLFVGVAFVIVHGPGGRRELVRNLGIASGTSTQGISSAGVGDKYSAAGQWNTNGLLTSNGAGTGDFTLLSFSAPVAESDATALLSSCSGSALPQAYLLANCNTAYAASSGALTFGTFSSGTAVMMSASSVIDGEPHVFVGVREAGVGYIDVDGRQKATTGMTPVSIYDSAAVVQTQGINGYTGWTSSAPGPQLVEIGWNRALTSAERAEVGNASALWRQIYQPQSIWVPVSAGGGTATDLTIADATHSHTADSPTISVDSTLAVQDATHAHSADNLTLSTSGTVSLTIADAAHAHVADSPTLTVGYVDLLVSDALHGHAADSLTLSVSGATNLVIQDAVHGHAADSLTISLGYIDLTVADGLHGHTADSLTLSVVEYTALVIARAMHGHLADNVTVSAALPTIGRPASDASNSGWAASTGSDLYAMLDEVTPDAGDYIVTTSTGSICEMPLQTTEYPGTAAQVLSYRASSSTGNSVIVRLKNTGGATVRTETQVLTASDTLYQITLTAPEIAAITSGALSVELESA